MYEKYRGGALQITSAGYQFLLTLLMPSKSVSFMAETLPEVKAEKAKIEKPSAKRSRSFITICPVPSFSQSISSMHRLLIICKFVRCMIIDVHFADTDDNFLGYMQASLERSRQL